MKKYVKFLWSLLRHKWFVFVESCKLGIPWLGIIHDWSKFLPSEFIPYAKYFYGEYEYEKLDDVPLFKIPYDAETKEDAKRNFDIAWLYHQKRNRHHWQYFILQYDNEERYFIQQHSIETPMMLALHNKQLFEVYVPCWEKDDEIYSVVYRRLVDVRNELNRAPVCIAMPDRYRREMLADWRGAGKAYGNPDTKAWYLEHKDNIILHPETRRWIEDQLNVE